MLKSGAQRKKKVKVAVRMRPFLEQEEGSKIPITLTKDTVELVNPKNQDEILHYKFDACHDSKGTQKQIFNENILPLVDNVFKGINTTIFAYGNTGAGKTFTMTGSKSSPGICPRFFKELFDRVDSLADKYSCTLQMSFFELYNEKLLDLLEPKNQDLQIREDRNRGITIPNLSSKEIKSVEEFEHWFSRGTKNRSTAATKLNNSSSRSHSIILLETECISFREADAVTWSKFHLIDLAGSEDNRRTENSGMRLVESGAINKSLFVLGQVVDALNDGSIRVPYRDSKLTRLLQDSLGGNASSLLIANLSPNFGHYLDTYNTLNFASKSKQITTRVVEEEKQQRPSSFKKVVFEKSSETKPSSGSKTSTEPKKSSALDSAEILKFLTPRTKNKTGLAHLQMAKQLEREGKAAESIEHLTMGAKCLGGNNLKKRKPRDSDLFELEDETETPAKKPKKNTHIIPPTPIRELQRIKNDMKPQLEKEALELINSGSLSDLTRVTGIGKKTAEKIIQLRAEHGEIAEAIDAKKVGLSKGKWQKILDYLMNIKVEM